MRQPSLETADKERAGKVLRDKPPSQALSSHQGPLSVAAPDVDYHNNLLRLESMSLGLLSVVGCPLNNPRKKKKKKAKNRSNLKTAFAIEDEKTTGAPWFALKLALRDLSSYIHTHKKKIDKEE